MTPPSGEKVIEIIRSRTDTALLAFSCGKDSLAAWLALRGKIRVVPYYMYLIPELEFVERSLTYYEDWFGTRIVRVPHPSLYRMLTHYVFQPPERCAIIERAQFSQVTYHDITDLLREDLALPEAWCATGVRAADSPARRIAAAKVGPIQEKTRTFWPVWDWRIADVWGAISAASVKLPRDYELFGRTFDGVDHRFLAPIREHYPRDYERILQWFPLAHLEIARREYAQADRFVAAQNAGV